MSGDLGPRVVIAAAIDVVASNAQVELILFGDQTELDALLYPHLSSFPHRIRVVHAEDVIAMDENPATALRHKKTSSMWMALEAVRDGLADACVSAGNTGALMAISRHLLRTYSGIDRPAICKALPTERGRTYMLDMGANLTCEPKQLLEFALMGSVLAEAVTDQPKVALLNVGVEPEKGTADIKAAQLLLAQHSQLNYIGFIEANDILSGRADVIVCNGFVGNVALKSIEGTAKHIGEKIMRSYRQSFWGRCLALLSLPLIKRWKIELMPDRYNGAIFLGLNKTVIKSHGNADQAGFAGAILVAIEQVELRVAERIGQQLIKNSL